MRRKNAWCFGLILCLALAAAHWLDLANWIDPQTGFVSAGTVWMRYGLAAFGIVLLFVLARAGSPKDQKLACGRSVLVGVGAILAGLAFVVAGAVSLMSFAGSALYGILDGVLFAWMGVGLMVDGAGALHSIGGAPVHSVWLGLGTMAALLWLCIRRFILEPAAVVRTSQVMLVFSALGALLFSVSYLRMFYAPDSTVPRSLLFSGMVCFLLCTCGELLQVVCRVMYGTENAAEIAVGVALGLFGIVGLLAAVRSQREGKETA